MATQVDLEKVCELVDNSPDDAPTAATRSPRMGRLGPNQDCQQEDNTMSQTTQPSGPDSRPPEKPTPRFEDLAEALFVTAEAAKVRAGIIEAQLLYCRTLSTKQRDDRKDEASSRE